MAQLWHALALVVLLSGCCVLGRDNKLSLRARELMEGPSVNKEHSDLRIIDGEDAVKGEFNWQVLVTGANKDEEAYLCGGSIYDKDWIMTAAHCVMEGYDLTVAAGIIELNETEDAQIVAVEKSVTHADFNKTGMAENDIAMLKLKESLNFTDNVNKIEMPYQREGSLGRICSVSGWGQTNNSEEYPAMPLTMQTADVIVVADEECVKACEKGEDTDDPDDCKMTSELLCAGDVKGGPQPCHGDSGGALVCSRADDTKYAAGIVSHGYECGLPNYLARYTEVSYYLDWIDDAIEGGSGASTVSLAGCVFFLALLFNKYV